MCGETRMFFDLHFKKDKFLELLRDQIQRALPLVTDEFASPVGGDPLVIDHLDVASVVAADAPPAATVTLQGPSGDVEIDTTAVEVLVGVNADLTTKANAIAAGHLGTPVIEFNNFAFEVTVHLSAGVDTDGSILLLADPVGIRDILGLLDDATLAALLDMLPSFSRPISLPDVAGTPLTATNAGLVLDGEVIALRAELTDPTNGSINAWESWFGGSLGFSTDDDWSVMIPKGLLVDVVDDAITDAVNSFPEADPSIEVVSAPSTTWSVLGASSTATINAVDACPAFDIDIEVDLNFSVRFTLASCGLRVKITVEWDLDDLDVFACGAALVLIPGAIITVLAGVLGGPVGAIIAAVVTIITLIVALVEISDEAHGQLSEGVGDIDPGDLDLQVIENDDEHAVIQGCVPLDLTLPGMEVTGVLTTAAGLLVRGMLDVPAHHDRTLAATGESGFGWDAGYSCSSHSYEIDQIGAQLRIGDPNHQPVAAEVTLLTEPDAYTISWQAWSFADPAGGWFSPGLTIEAISHLDANEPPDCEILVHTNSGIRYANLGRIHTKPQPPSPDKLILLRVNCFKPKLPGPKKWLEAQWLIDPPPFEHVQDSVRVWELVASGVGAGLPVELATIEEGEEEAIVMTTMSASHSGSVSFRVATGPAEHVAVAVSRKSRDATLHVAGASLEVIGRYTPRRGLIDATLLGSGPGAVVALGTRDHVLLFGLDGGLQRDLRVPGVRSLAALGSRLYALDHQGVVALDARSGALRADERRWQGRGELVGLSAEAHQLVIRRADGARVVVDRDLQPARQAHRRTNGEWISERWLRGPVRSGRLFVRALDGEATVYRCAQRQLF